MTEIPVNLYPEIYPALNVADIDVVEGAAGPGRRVVVWLQGCLKRCAGCANGPFLPSVGARIISPDDMFKEFVARGPVDGLTLSGGEPALQAAALLPVLRQVREDGWNVVCYSGYQIEELRAPNAHALLADYLSQIDLLIDGEYKRELGRAGIYRPSSNQRLHYLSERIRPDAFADTPETVVRIAGSKAFATGTLPIQIRKQLFAGLRKAGIVLTPL